MVDVDWVLALMLRAEPAAASSPWRSTYKKTAAAFARAATARPLFSGADGADRTAALLVSVAWFESRFQQNAEGDHEIVNGKKDLSKPNSFCAMQIGKSNFAGLGVTAEALLSDIDLCVDTGLRLMHVSFGVCRAAPLEHRLDHYATGGEGCRVPPHDEGGNRIRKAQWLFKNVAHPG